MARPSQQNKKPAPPPGSPIRDQDGDTPMANATPTKAAQEARERSSSILETPTRAPRSSLLGRSLPKEDITTPRRLRSTSTASSINEAIVPTPGMVPRSRSAKNNQSMPPSTPQRGAKTSTSTATPGLPALPPSMTPGMGLSSLASSSSFRSSVLAGERPMPETPAKATMGTPKEMPERRRSTRFSK
ncbi:hypothetical protein F4805DRAFT_106549 [Annulohypoxylon moriforme]|nr:hypothetical protein F4805DRAFT_106549 [Annulohypoxylon moriforme]